MNTIDQERRDRAVSLFLAGASVREVSKAAGMARETSHRIQKSLRNTKKVEVDVSKITAPDVVRSSKRLIQEREAIIAQSQMEIEALKTTLVLLKEYDK